FREHPGAIRLAAVCDTNPAAARARAADMGLPESAVYTDPMKMLRDAPIDAVDLCTTHASHAELTLAAAHAGKHVLVEKPMACSMAECRAMIDAHAKAGTTLMVAQMQRFEPRYVALKRLIDSGQIGRINAVRLDAMQNLRAYMPPGHWLYDGKIAGGGIVISVMIHRIDLLRYLVGDVRSVAGVCRTVDPQAFINGAEDFAAGTLEFENGAIGDLFGTYFGPTCPYGESFTLFADKATLHAIPPIGTYNTEASISHLDNTRSDLKDKWGDVYGNWQSISPEQAGLSSSNGFINQLLHFADCCRTGERPITDGRDNIRSMAVVFALYESSRRGGAPVQLDSL
ncbi:MAG TPA: Gfo/Idh/MocA family oxidoreductase, partial [Tepidisphaeraceae bacterium]|nr:Gfo/Idh/MocA family oxidoreductase [Tepidisphaeraceae bacterium]